MSKNDNFLLKENLHGLYLYNSAAMGKFEAKYSDIDFIVVIKNTLFHRVQAPPRKKGSEGPIQ